MKENAESAKLTLILKRGNKMLKMMLKRFKDIPGIWRIQTVLKKLLSISNLKSHRIVLENVLAYYMALVINIPSNLYNIDFLFKLKDGSTIIIPSWIHVYIFDEIYIDKCYDINFIKNPSTIIDIGANIGIFTIRAAKRWPNAQILCYEPEHSNFKLLRKNLSLNFINNAKLFKLGVAKEESSQVLHMNPKNRGMHSIYETNESSQYIEIQCTCLKKLFEENGIKMCDLLKLDCEGAEYEIIESLDEDLSSRIKCIVAEVTPKRSQDIEAPRMIKENLISLGYTVHFSNGTLFACMCK